MHPPFLCGRTRSHARLTNDKAAASAVATTEQHENTPIPTPRVQNRCTKIMCTHVRINSFSSRLVGSVAVFFVRFDHFESALHCGCISLWARCKMCFLCSWAAHYKWQISRATNQPPRTCQKHDKFVCHFVCLFGLVHHWFPLNPLLLLLAHFLSQTFRLSGQATAGSNRIRKHIYKT